MKHTLLFLLTATASFAGSEPPLEAQWSRVCDAARGREVTITTATGETVRGYCMSVQVDRVEVRTFDQKVVKVGRAALAKIQVSRSENQLRALHRGVHGALHQTVGMVFSPAAPIGLVGTPIVLAWGAVAAPFCILGDVAHLGKREIKVIP